MNRYISGSIKVLLLTLGGTAASFGQTDWVASVVPPAALFEALAVSRDLATPARPKYNSTTDLVVSPDKKILFVAQQTAKRIDMVDVATEKVTGAIRLPNEVTGIAVAPKGDLLYATCSSDEWPAGMVCVVDIMTRKVTHTIAAGFGSRAPVVTPDGLKLFVCNRFGNDLSVIDLTSRSEVKRLKMVREPYCAAISPDGKTVVVGNLLSGDRSTDTAVIACKVTLVNAVTLIVDKEIRLYKGSTGITGVAVSPDGNYAFVVHAVETFNRVITTVDRGWSTLSKLTVIDLRTRDYVYDVMLDKPMKGMANPWDLAFTGDGQYLCITHAGSNDLSVISYPVLMDSVETHTRQGFTLLRNFTLLDSIRRIVTITGQSPRTLAVVDSTVYTAGFFDDENAAIQKCMITKDTIITAQFPAGPKVVPTMERKGEALFYDASLCFQEWQSCHTCHLFTRASGLNRILGGGAMTVPKNTKSLLYSWWTPPVTWSGRRGAADMAIKASIELELFRMPTADLAAPLDSFARAIRPMASPWREKGKLSDAAQRGRVLFIGERAQCSKCHAGPLFTDNKYHAASVPDPLDPTKDYNTPSLVEAWRTGPYGHLGSIWYLQEMIELPGHNDARANLSIAEMDDLVAYVSSL